MTADGGTVQCACCESAASVRVRWFVTGPGWQEKDLCQAHANQVHEGTAGAVAGLHAPAVTYGKPGVPIFDRKIVQRSRAADRDDMAALL